MNTRKAGKDYEDAAEDYLKSKGYRTLEKNYHCRYGEIDLIVRSEEGAVVFVCANYKVWILLACPLYHLKERTLHLLAIYHKDTIKDFVSAVLAVYL